MWHKKMRRWGRGKIMGNNTFKFDVNCLKNQYNQFPFLFEHNLHLNESMLCLSELYHLAMRLPETQVLHYSAQVPVSANFDSVATSFAPDQSLQSAMSNMQSA